MKGVIIFQDTENFKQTNKKKLEKGHTFSDILSNSEQRKTLKMNMQQGSIGVSSIQGPPSSVNCVLFFMDDSITLVFPWKITKDSNFY